MSIPTQKVQGTDFRNAQISNLTPEQMNFFREMLQHSQASAGASIGQLSRMAQGDESTYQSLEAPAYRQFGELQDRIANRFSGANGQRSSGFQNAQSGAAQSFAENLQADRMRMRNESIQSLLGLYQNLIGQRTSENTLIENNPKKPKWWQSLLGSAGAAAGSFFGPGASAAGSSIGKWAGDKAVDYFNRPSVPKPLI